MKKINFTCLLIILTSLSIWAQMDESKLHVGLQLRSRAELRDGALMPKTEDSDPAGFINNRTRLNLGYLRDFLEVGVSIQHVGVWGDDKQIHKDSDLGVHEAWAKMHLGHGFFVKVGRQVLSYDDQRILGALDWHVAGRHHDALKLGYEESIHKLHLILAFNQNKENIEGTYYDHNSGQPYKSMQTLWYNVSPTPYAKLSFLFMNLGLQSDDDTKYMQTMGSYMDFSITPKLGATLSGYYQMGNTKADKDISAYMVSAVLDYKFNNKFKGKIGTDYLSGQDDSNDVTSFDPLYGTHHKFYGSMDYFYVSSPFANGLKPGLWDSYIGFTSVAHPKFSYGITYHYFQFAEDYRIKDLDKDLGSEFDINMKWNIHKDISLSGGFSFALLSESMDVVKGGDSDEFQSWGWLSLNITPNLFTR